MWIRKNRTLDLAIGFLLACAAYVLYRTTLSSGPYPGESTAIFLSTSGLYPRFTPAHPWWFLATDAWLSLFQNVDPADALNRFTALVSALSIWLFYEVTRRSLALFIRNDDENLLCLALGSRIGGVLAAGMLAVSVGFWSISNRCHWASFDILLLLAVSLVFLSSVYHGSSIRGFIFAFLFGVGFVEYPGFIVFAPLFAVAFFYTAYEDERLTTALMSKMLGAFALGLVAYVPAVMLFSSTEGAAYQDFESTWHIYTRMWSDQWVALSRSMPRQGWLIILLSTGIPFLTSMGLAKRALNRQGDWSLLTLHVVVTGVCISIFLDVPSAPWTITGGQRVPVIPYLVSAWTFGYLAAYWFLLPHPQWGWGKDSSAGSVSKIFSIILPALFFVPLIYGGRHAAKAADARPSAIIYKIANVMAEGLKTKSWVFSDGALDAQLMSILRHKEMPTRVISFGIMRNRYVAEYVSDQFEDPELQNLSRVGLRPLFKAWLQRESDAGRELAIMYPPYLWREAGYTAVPNVLFFEGERKTDAVDLDELMQKHRKAWEDLGPSLHASLPEGHRIRAFQSHLKGRMAFVANELGVFMEDHDNPGLAFEAYRAALSMDPENVSAVLNAKTLVQSGYKAKDTESLDAKYEELKSRFSREPAHVVSLMSRYGTIRQSRAILSQGIHWARGGNPALATLEVERALGLAPQEKTGALRETLASLYLHQSRHGESEDILLKMLESDPDNIRTIMMLVQFETARNNFSGARDYLARAEAAGASARDLRIEAMSIRLTEGATEDIENELRPLLAEYPRSVRLWEMLLTAHILKRDRKGLQHSIMRLERITGGRGFLLSLASAHLAIMQDDVNGVRRHFEDALNFQPDNLAILKLMLKLDAALGYMDVSERRARNILAIDPGDADANLYMANFQILRGDYELAKDSLRRSMLSGETATGLNSLAWLLKETGALEEAEEKARAALALDGSMPSAWDTLGVIQHRQGDISAAVASFEKAMQLQERYPAAVLHLAGLYLEQNDRARALALVESIAEDRYDLSEVNRKNLAVLAEKLGLSW